MNPIAREILCQRTSRDVVVAEQPSEMSVDFEMKDITAGLFANALLLAFLGGIPLAYYLGMKFNLAAYILPSEAHETERIQSVLLASGMSGVVVFLVLMASLTGYIHNRYLAKVEERKVD